MTHGGHQQMLTSKGSVSVQVFSCPGSRIDEDADVLAPRRMPYMPGEQLMRSAALGSNQVKAEDLKTRSGVASELHQVGR
eukprot:Skav235309  [mRNA]  locus=scaffold520:277946:279984:- [translate_table: standard]